MKMIRKFVGLIFLSFIFVTAGCDSGQQAVDEVTGNRAVKQYHKSAEDLEKIADQQEQRHQGAAEGETR